ncbi:MAG: DUF2157 domain-containing protein [Synechococcales bacterium]|nr:DUF2157 domain-containing protein [Synechococcales bacterium]
MVSESFRRQLRQEAARWQQDGLISPEQYQQLANRYRLDRLDTAARDRFIAILLALGGVLLGIGVITFVAANWQSIPRGVKVILLLALFFGINWAGFSLWRSGQGTDGGDWRQRLGHGLLILGALTLGATLALFGQLFHQSGSAAGLCIIWGLGVVGMAYGLRLTSLGLLAGLLVGMGYWLGIRDFVFNEVQATGMDLLLREMPLVAGVLFLPLAYWCRSTLLFGLTAIAVFSSLLMGFGQINPDWVNTTATATVLLILTFTLPPAFLWAYGDDLWLGIGGFLRRPLGWVGDRPQEPPANFRPTARDFAILYLSIGVYIFSFHWSWLETTVSPTPEDASLGLALVAPWISSVSLPVLTVLLIVQWLWLAGWGGDWAGRSRDSQRFNQMDATILAILGAIAIILAIHWSLTPLPALGTFVFNGLLFLLGAGLMREGLGDGTRRQFWLGLILLTLQILSRVLEYETGLLLKSLTFLLCGVGVMAIGLWFERHVRTLAAAPPLTATREEDPS